MIRLFALLLLIIATPLRADGGGRPSTFHRLLLFNAQQEMLVIRFEGTQRWVTPGWYQDGQKSIHDGLHALAAAHGFRISAPRLRGVFTLQDASGAVTSTRLVHAAQVTGGKPITPEGIGEMRWLPVAEALEIITFPHVIAQLEVISEGPNVVWGGSQTMRPEGRPAASSIVQPFHPLTPPR